MKNTFKKSATLLGRWAFAVAIPAVPWEIQREIGLVFALGELVDKMGNNNNVHSGKLLYLMYLKIGPMIHIQEEHIKSSEVP